MRQPPANPDNIDIATLFRSIKRKIMGVAILALIAAVLTFTALSMMSRQFVSQSELTITAKGTTNPFAGPRAGASSQVLTSQVDKQAVNTHVRALQSPDLIAQVAQKLRLARLREFNAALGPQDAMGHFLQAIGFGGYNLGESERDRVLRAFINRLVVYSPAESRIITISFGSSDPQLAADIANMMAGDYRARLANATVVETDAVQKSLQPKIARRMQEVTAADAEVARFRASSGLFDGGTQKTPLNQQQLGELTAELTRASAARSALQARASTARDLIRRGNPEVIPQVQRSPLIQGLIQQRVQVARDLQKYSATMKRAHPRIRQLNADLASIKAQVAIEVAHVVASIDKEAHAAIVREAAIKKSLEALKTRVVESSDEQVELDRLLAVAKSKRAELARLQAQYESNRARADSGAVPVEAEIVTIAQPASVSTYPLKGPSTALAFAATFLSGMAWVITSALLQGARPQNQPARPQTEPSSKLRDEIASLARKPASRLKVAGGVFGEDPAPAGITTVTTPSELAAHLLRLGANMPTACRTLIASNADNNHAALLGRELGKALTSAKANTILIEWNPHTGSDDIAAVAPVSTLGITDLIKGTANFSQVVRVLPGGNTHTIGCGTPLASGENVDPEQLNVVLDALDEAYDQIVLAGALNPARKLFATIEGRVDTGVTIGRQESPGEPHSGGGSPATFLGFQVEGVTLLDFVPKPRKAKKRSVLSRMKRKRASTPASQQPQPPAP